MPNSVKIWTDYKNLNYFMIAKKLNYRQVIGLEYKRRGWKDNIKIYIYNMFIL